MASTLARIRPFTGKREAKENAEDFLDDVEFAAEQCSTDPPDDKMRIRLFRQHVEDRALDFWLDLEPEKKLVWTDIKELFLGKFGGARSLDQSERMSVTSRVMSLSQEKRSITEYVAEAKLLFREVPTELSEMFAICFVKGLSDAGKKSAVSFALRDGKIDFKRALEVVKASYMVIGEPDVFTSPVVEKSVVAASANTEVLSELLKFLKNSANRQSHGGTTNPVRTVPTASPAASAGAAQQQRAANPYVTCYNCGKTGHYVPECQEPQQPWEVRQGIRERAQKEASDYRERRNQKAIMAAAAVTETPNNASTDVVRANMAIVKVDDKATREVVKREKLLHICALLSKIPRASALVAAAGDKRERENSSDDEEALRAKVAKVNEKVGMFRGGSGNGEENKEKGSERDNRMGVDDENSESGDAPTTEQEEVPDRPEPGKEADDITGTATAGTGTSGEKETGGGQVSKKKKGKGGLAPIKAMNGLKSFDLSDYMQNLVVSIGLPQLLQDSPTLRRQLVMLLTSANPRKKRVTRAALALTGEEPVTDAPDIGEEGLEAMFIEVSIGGAKVSSVLVDGGSLIDLVSAKLVAALKLPVFTGEGWSILLANDATVKVNKYVWADITVARITARMKLYILDIDQSYTVLLSRRWLRRVKAVENYYDHTLVIEGSDNVRRVVVGKPTEGRVIEVFQDAEEELEGESEDEEEDVEEIDRAITELLDELEEWEYENDVDGDEDSEKGLEQ